MTMINGDGRCGVHGLVACPDCARYQEAVRQATIGPKWGPKKPDHPSVGRMCPACHKPFAAGDFTTLIALGPGDSEHDRALARADLPYTAVGLEVHWACAYG
jgi:hypothetical protein